MVFTGKHSATKDLDEKQKEKPNVNRGSTVPATRRCREFEWGKRTACSEIMKIPRAKNNNHIWSDGRFMCGIGNGIPSSGNSFCGIETISQHLSKYLKIAL